MRSNCTGHIYVLYQILVEHVLEIPSHLIGLELWCIDFHS